MVIDRIASTALNIAGKRRGSGVGLPQGLSCLRGLDKGFRSFRIQFRIALFQSPVANVFLGVKKQQGAEHRQEHDHHQPRDLGGGVHSAVEQIQYHKKREDYNAAVNVGQEGLEPVKDAEQEQHLHGQQDEDQSRAAEDHPENPPLALFQKVYPCFFGILFHNKPSLLEITKISANLMQQQFLTFIISLKSPI